MTLSGTLSPSPTGLAFDTVTPITQAVAQQFNTQGCLFVARYINRTVGVPSTPGAALCPSEAQLLLAAGLGLTLVQVGDNQLVPSANEGNVVGAAAAANALALGFPSGGTIWCDIEFTAAATPTSSQGTIQYINSWAAAVTSSGYAPGLYVGPNIPLSSTELFQSLPQIQSYWKSAALTPWVATRGFQMIQGLSLEVAGINVDSDIACYDNMGDRFQILSPAT